VAHVNRFPNGHRSGHDYVTTAAGWTYLNVGWCMWLVLTELVRDSQAAAAVTEQQLRGGGQS
jgi:hypothetical protein